MIDLSKFKVIYRETILRAVALVECVHKQETDFTEMGYNSFSFLRVLVVDTDGNLKEIYDHAWRFQFVPVISGRSDNNAE